MSKSEEVKDNDIQKNKKKKNIIVLVLMFLLLLCLFIVQCQLDQMKEAALRKQQETEYEAEQRRILDSLKALEKALADSLATADSLARLDSLARQDSLRAADSLRVLDSLNALKNNLTKEQRDSIRRVRDSIAHVNDSIAHLKDSLDKVNKRIADSLSALEKARLDSLEKKRILDSIRAADQIPPNAEITPPAGRYYDPIKMKVKCDEIKCKTYLSIGDTLHPQ